VNLDILDECLEAIERAKRELLRIDPTASTLDDLNAAYANLAASERAILRLLNPINEPTS
jgi:hypothetical protein